MKLLIIIRNFRPSDLTRVYEIETKSFKDPYHPLFLLNLYEAYHDSFFVAERNCLVVGYVIFRILGGKGHILALATDPRYRKRGIGRTLMEHIINYLRERGIREAWLEVRISNKSAIEFYKRMGFKEVGVTSSYYSDGEDAVILSKDLNIY